MLYVSTRNKTDSFTAHRTLCADRSPDGGLFVPHMIPRFAPNGCFCNIVADVLNLYFSTSLTQRDVELCIGRQPVRGKEMSYRLKILEFFHNPSGTYDYLEDNLYRKLAGADAQDKPTLWARIAIRMALLVAVCADITKEEYDEFDVSVNVGDFTTPMAVWYVREMGLPIGTIICCCNENGATWDLIRRGEMHTGSATVNTGMPELDYGSPTALECLIYHKLGFDESIRYVQMCMQKRDYAIEKDQLATLSCGLSATVVSRDRIDGLINNIRTTSGHCLTDRAAISYGGVQDYRSRSGESRNTMIFIDSDPSIN